MVGKIHLKQVGDRPELVSFPYGDGESRLAHRFIASFDAAPNVDPHRCDIVVPALPSGEVDVAAVKLTRTLLENLPKTHADAVDFITVHSGRSSSDAHWAQKFNRPGFESMANAGQDRYGLRRINFFPTAMARSPIEFLNVGRHEFGHLLAIKLWNTNEPPPAWIKAALADFQSVSAYADLNYVEDFAETVAYYLASDGGKRFPGLRKQFANRFKMLDEIFANNPSKLPSIQELVKSLSRIPYLPAILSTSVAAGGIGVVYWQFGDVIFEHSPK